VPIRVAHPMRKERAAGALLEVERARVTYGGIQGIRSVSLRVDAGEIVALLGANGAGKSTTLRSVARLVPLAAGAVRFAGRDLAQLAPEDVAAMGVSLVPEGRAIFSPLSVRENLELGAYAHRDRAAIRETIEDVTALFPRLAERMHQLGGTLSGGEQQMLSIARALMARPTLLLLDEPSLGIAPKLVQQIFGAIREIARSGVTILLVEQNTRLALATAQRAYVLRDGEVALEGDARELAENPEVRAAYLGG